MISSYISGALLSGCTNSCTTTLHDNIEKAYYSHPFNFDTYLSFSKEDVEGVIFFLFEFMSDLKFPCCHIFLIEE